MPSSGELMLERLPLVTVLASDTAGDKEQVSNKVTFLMVHKALDIAILPLRTKGTMKSEIYINNK